MSISSGSIDIFEDKGHLRRGIRRGSVAPDANKGRE